MNGYEKYTFGNSVTGMENELLYNYSPIGLPEYFTIRICSMRSTKESPVFHLFTSK